MNAPLPRPDGPKPVSIRRGAFVGAAVATVLLAGCLGIRTSGEKQARQAVEDVGNVYRPEDRRPSQSALRAESGLSEFLQFAILNRPQVEAALRGVDTEAGEAPILLAYEPVWAIGVNGIPATADYASERHRGIAEVAKSILGRPVPVLYGGSVNPGNCEELIGEPHIDGLFIGRSAWSVEGYLDILARVSAAIDRSSPRQTASERKLP